MVDLSVEMLDRTVNDIDISEDRQQSPALKGEREKRGGKNPPRPGKLRPRKMRSTLRSKTGLIDTKKSYNLLGFL